MKVSRWIWIPAACSVTSAFLAWIWLTIDPIEGQQVDPGGAVAGSVVVFILTLHFTDACRGSRAALVGLPVILSADLGVWGYSYILPRGLETVAGIAARAEAPAIDEAATIHAGGTDAPNLALLRGFGVAQPYVGLFPGRSLLLTTSNELRVAGVHWIQTGEGWEQVPDPVPRVRVVPEAVQAPPSVIFDSRFDIRQIAVVDRPLPPLDGDARATLIEDTDDRMAVDIAAEGAALLVTTVAYHNGWRAVAEHGGTPTTVRVYGDYLGVLLGPGEYRLTLEFDPASFRHGTFLSIAGLMGLAALALTVARSERKSPTDTALVRQAPRSKLMRRT
jgi:hypothetical protein